jgi:transglutaminase-like putative cysteine protease
MKYYLSLALAIVSINTAFAQVDYDVAKIPEPLKKDAVAVVRNEESFFDVKGLGAAKMDYKVAITILNKAGEGFGEMAEVYDKFTSIYNIRATLYDAAGKKVKDYKSSDIKDQSLISDFSIFEDNRLKLLKFVSIAYPYTVEYSYSQDYNGLLSFPSWRDLKGFGVSVEKSAYTIQKAKNYKMRYLTSRNLQTDSVLNGEKIQYKWKSANIAAIADEPLSTGIDNISAWVKASPNQFEYDGSTGNFDNWKNFGSWLYTLNQGGNKLPEATKLMVQNLIKDAKTPKEKMRILYNHLQQNTRYVSVQLGIGGFRPILAEKVAQVNYGDCKALSNYMKALLNEAGIPSNLIVIGNDMPSLNPTYSSMGQANHMILCVPLAKDTTFLECTSQYKPMGFIGYSNSDRNVLMITEDGGKIVHTPVYNAKENYQIRKTKITLAEDGTASSEIRSTYGNAQFEENFSMTLMEPVDLRKKIIEDSSIPVAELISYKYVQADKTIPVLTEEINFKTNPLLTKGGDKLFLVVNQINRRESVPLKVENRKTYFAVPFSYNDDDEISYILPKGYNVEFIPKDITITSEFGSYTAKFSVKDNMIVYSRTQTMNDKKYPPEKYGEYVDFYKKIYQADKQKAVLTKTL